MSFTHELLALGAYALALAVLLLLKRWLGTFWSVTAFFLVSLAYLELGFDPPVPASLFKMFAYVGLLCVVLYATSSAELTRSFLRPIRAVMVETRLLPVLALFLVAIPAVAGWQAYVGGLPSAFAPPKTRNIHPAPPNTITFTEPGAQEGHVFDVIKGHNPLRELETTDPAAFAEVVARGKTVYYENCFYCHGDTLDGDGHFADAVTPVPAKFQAKDTIPMLTEAFLFWRIAKGGPGLPSEGTPWDSTMPVWEKFLSEDDIWACITFLYDYTGYEPRAQAAQGAH